MLQLKRFAFWNFRTYLFLLLRPIFKCFFIVKYSSQKTSLLSSSTMMEGQVNGASSNGRRKQSISVHENRENGKLHFSNDLSTSLRLFAVLISLPLMHKVVCKAISSS